MTFINNETGEALDFNGDFAITKQSVSFFNGDIKGDVSTTFTLDNNSVNRKILGYNGPHMLNQVAWTKQPFNRVRNGNILDKGYIVIQNDNGPTLSCFYVSGNSNWIQILQGLITELDFTGIASAKDYTMQWSATAVTNRVSATEGITFPLVDWSNGLNKGDSNFHLIINGPINDFSADFYPCFYLHTLVNELCSQNGLKINGNILNDGLYKSIVLTPVSGQMKRSDFFTILCYGNNQNLLVDGNYTSFSTTDTSGVFVNGRYTAQTNQLIGVKVVYVSTVLDVYLMKNGVTQLGHYIVSGIPSPGDIYFGTTYYFYLNKGDYLNLYCESTPGTVQLNWFFFLNEDIVPTDTANPSYFLPKFKAASIIKFLVSFFGCASYFDEGSKSISINIIDKLKLEDSQDWSKYYVSHQSFYTIDRGANNYLRVEDNGTDPEIEAYNARNERNFGDGNIRTGNTLKTNSEANKIPFAASFTGLSTNGIFYASVPLIDYSDGQSTSFTSISDLGGGISQLNGVTTSFLPGNKVRISDGTTDYGIFLVTGTGATVIQIRMTFSSSFSGYAYLQNQTVQDITPRILTVKPNTSLSDVSNITTITAIGDTIGTSSATYTALPYATYCKQLSSEPIDQWRNNLAYDNPNITGYNDPTVKELYFNKISSFFNNPNIRATFILPEAIFQSFKFDRFIYLKTEQLTGYFFVESIEGYKDGNTPVSINLYML